MIDFTRRLAGLVFPAAFLTALSLAGCAKSGPELTPASSGPCSSGQAKSGLSIRYGTGTGFNEDLKAFEAYADGHVDVHQSMMMNGGVGVVDRTVTMMPADVSALVDDVAHTGALDNAPGCYSYASDEPVLTDVDTGGYTFAVSRTNGLYDFDVNGPAPSSVDATGQRLAQFMDGLAKR